MTQIRFVFRDSSGRLHSNKPAKIILPLPLPHQLENGTDMRTIQDAITYLQQREIPKRLWNVENNQVKAVHTVCRDGLETTQQGPMFAIYDSDVISYSMIPDEDYIIVTCKEDEAVTMNNDGDVITEAMQETQTQTPTNTTTRESLAIENDSGDMNSVAVANINDTIPPNCKVTPNQTLENLVTDRPSTTVQHKKSSNEGDCNNTSIKQASTLTAQKRKESTLESNTTTNAKKMKVAMQNDQILESTNGNTYVSTSSGQNSYSKTTTESTPASDTTIDSTSIVQVSQPTAPKRKDPATEIGIEEKSISIASKRKESTPESDTVTESNKSIAGMQTETLDRRTDAKSNSNSVPDKLTDTQKEDMANVKIDMIKKMRNVQFPRQTKFDERWMERFEQLKEYKMKHGHMLVRWIEDKDLNEWISKQRSFKRNSKLREDRMKLLEEIGFAWESEFYHQSFDERRMNRINTGTEQAPPPTIQQRIDPTPKSDVAPNSPNLGQGSLSIASTRKESTPECDEITETKKSKVGTQTDTLDGQTSKDSDSPFQSTWKENFQQLKTFFDKHGHSQINKSNHTVGVFATQLKLNSVRDKLTDEQKADLASVNFHLFNTFKKMDTRWMEKFEQLKEYKRKYGHLKVRRKEEDKGLAPKGLYQWIPVQRSLKRHSKLRNDRMKLLEEIGFKWGDHKEQVSISRTSKCEESTPESNKATDSTNVERVSQPTAPKRKDPVAEIGIEEKSISIASKRKESTPESATVTESNKLIAGTQTETLDRKIDAKSNSNSVPDKLTDTQKEDMVNVKFIQFPRQTKFDERWMERFHKLKEYKMKHGHTMVRGFEDQDLNQWIRNQRSFKRNSKLRNDRMKLLEEIGFKWGDHKEQVSISRTSKCEESTPESNTVTDATSVERVPLSIAQKRKDPATESGVVLDSLQSTGCPKFDDRWIERFHKLKEYKMKHGHTMVRWIEDKDLYTWIRNQRNLKRNSKLRNDRMELLEKIGLCWESNTSIAQKRKESSPEIDTGTESTGREQVLPSKEPTCKESTQACDTETEPKKFKIVKQPDENQETPNEDTLNSASYEQSLLSTASKRKESTLGSDTAIGLRILQVEKEPDQNQETPNDCTITSDSLDQDFFSESWMKNYHNLKEYKNRNGHTTVLMRHDKDLHEWAVHQRDSKRNNELCENQVTLLEEIGFKWSKRTWDARWMNKYDKLQKYKKKHGHVMVKRSQDKELYRWTVHQRFTKRHNELCEDRAKLLEDVGFVWGEDTPMTNESNEQKPLTNESNEQKITDHEKDNLGVRMERWMKNYHKLKDFKKKHGHLILQESHDRVLYRWMQNQKRIFKRKGIMYEDRVKQLEEIGFVLDGSLAIQRSSSKKRKRATNNDDIKSHTVPKKLAKSLALPTDPENLNKLHQFVRSDLLEIIQENHKIGLQCIFCKTSPEPQSRSKFFPQYLENKGLGLYRKTCEWQRVHFKQCTHVPDAVKEKYDELKLAHKSRGKVQYWEDSAKQIGLFNKEGGGIGFIGDKNDGNSEAELARE